MATDLTSSNLSALLKIAYADAFYQDILFKSNALLGILPKKIKGGKNMDQPLSFAGAQNISADFATAEAGTSKTSQDGFTIPYKELFGSFLINDKEASASKSKGLQAYVEAINHEIVMATKEFSANLARQLYRKSDGALGVIGSVSSDVITLATREDMVNFHKGMQVVAYTSAGVARDSGTAKTITKVSRSAGGATITLNAEITGMAATDIIYAKGDKDARANGILDWVPSQADRDAGVLSTTFLGVDRSVDDVSLAGIAVDGSALPMEEAFILAESELEMFGAKPTICLMNPSDFRNLSIELSSKEQIQKGGTVNANTSAVIGYEMFSIAGCGAKVVKDPNCPKGFAFFVDPQDWFLGHMDKDVVNNWDLDSLQMSRKSGSNAVQGIVKSYYNLICRVPKNNLVLTLPSS